jgi:hypothetical protein
MIDFIVKAGIDDELRAIEKETDRAKMIALARRIARTYNGKEYAKNNYHTRLVNRLEFWRGKPDTPWSPDMAAQEDIEEASAAEVAAVTGPQPMPAPVKKVLKDAAAENRISTTELVAIGTGVSGAAKAVKEATDAVSDAGASLVSAGPWILLSLLVMGFAGYIWMERRRKRNDARSVL